MLRTNCSNIYCQQGRDRPRLRSNLKPRQQLPLNNLVAFNLGKVCENLGQVTFHDFGEIHTCISHTELCLRISFHSEIVFRYFWMRHNICNFLTRIINYSQSDSETRNSNFTSIILYCFIKNIRIDYKSRGSSKIVVAALVFESGE